MASPPITTPPPTTNGTMPEVRWSLKSVNQPYEEAGLYKVIVRSTSRDKEGTLEDFVTMSTLERAIDLVYNFYGKIDIPGTDSSGGSGHASKTLKEKITPESAMAGSNVVAMTVVDHFIDDRPNSAIKLLITFSKMAIDRKADYTFDPSQIVHQKHFEFQSLERQVKKLKKLFMDYHNVAKFFDGRISPYINFKKEYERLASWYDSLVEFVEFNNIRKTSDENDTIILSLDENYGLLQVEVIQQGIASTLLRGYDHYKSKTALGNARTNALSLNITEISKVRKDPITWSEFIKRYFIAGSSTEQIKITHTGRSRTPSVSDEMAAEANDKNKLFQTEADAEEERRQIRLNTQRSQRMYNEAASEAETSLEQDLRKIAKEIKKINSAEKLVRDFIMRYGIDNLISAGLECLASRAGIDPDSIPPIPGIDPYSLPTPPTEIKFPKFPMEIPTFDPAAEIQKGIKEGMKKALEEAIKAMVNAVADMISDMCADKDYGQAEPLSLAITGNLTPIEEDKGPGALDSCFEDHGMTRNEGIMFVDSVSDVLSPTEVCDLLNGSPSTSVMEAILDIVGQQNLELNFMTEESVLDFFGCLGDLIDPSYCDAIYNPPILPAEVDPCLFEDSLIDALGDEQAFNDLNDLLDLINNDEPVTDPMSICESGIIPALSGMPAMAHSMGKALDGVLGPAQTSFINDVSGLKSLYLRVDRSQPNFELIEQLVAAGALNTPSEEEEAAREEKMNSLNNFFALDAFAGNEDLANIASLVERGNNAVMAGAKFVVQAPIRRTLLNFVEEIQTPWNPEIPNSFNWAFSIGTDSDDIHFGSPNLIAIQDTQSGDTMSHPEGIEIPELYNASYTTARNLTAMEFGQKIRDSLSSLGGSSSAAVMNDLANVEYFNTVLYMAESAAEGILNSDLFDSEEFRKFSLVPVPCQDGTELNAADLLDIENIKQTALNDFFQGACIEGDYEIGPLEDAMMFAVTNVYIQVYVVEQLLKNIFLFNTYGTAEVLSDPVLLKKMVEDIKNSFSIEAERISPEDPSSVEPSLHTTIEELSKIYVRKLLAAPPENSLPDLINEGQFILMEPSEVTAAFALEYIVQKRLKDASETIGAILTGGSTASFHGQYLANGLPTSELWTPRDGTLELQQSSGGNGYTYKYLLDVPIGAADEDYSPELPAVPSSGLGIERYVLMHLNETLVSTLSGLEQYIINNIIIPELGPHFQQQADRRRYILSFDEFSTFLTRSAQFADVSEILDELPPVTLAAANGSGVSRKDIKIDENNYEALRFMSNLISHEMDGSTALIGPLRDATQTGDQYPDPLTDHAEKLFIPESFWTTTYGQPRADWTAPHYIYNDDFDEMSVGFPDSWGEYNPSLGADPATPNVPRRIYLTPPNNGNWVSNGVVQYNQFKYYSPQGHAEQVDPNETQPAGILNFWSAVENFPVFLREIPLSVLRDLNNQPSIAPSGDYQFSQTAPPFSTVFENIRLGARLIYYTPYKQFSELEPRGYFETYGQDLTQQEQKWLEYRTGPPIRGGNNKYIFPVDIGAYGAIQIAENRQELLGSSSNYIYAKFRSSKSELYESLASSAGYRDLFVNDLYGSPILPAREIIAFFALLSQAVSDNKSADINKMFDDTKLNLRFVMRALLAGNDYAFEDPEDRSSAQAARDAVLGIVGAGAAPFAQMGASFVLKMLIETPKMIVKGLAEILDPHVVIGTQIRNITGPILQSIPSSLPFDELLQLLQEEIETKADQDGIPGPLVPQIKKTGIDMVGKLPLLFLPPPTPLGILYILLNMNLEDLIELPDCDSE